MCTQCSVYVVVLTSMLLWLESAIEQGGMQMMCINTGNSSPQNFLVYRIACLTKIAEESTTEYANVQCG